MNKYDEYRLQKVIHQAEIISRFLPKITSSGKLIQPRVLGYSFMLTLNLGKTIHQLEQEEEIKDFSDLVNAYEALYQVVECMTYFSCFFSFFDEDYEVVAKKIIDTITQQLLEDSKEEDRYQKLIFSLAVMLRNFDEPLRKQLTDSQSIIYESGLCFQYMYDHQKELFPYIGFSIDQVSKKDPEKANLLSEEWEKFIEYSNDFIEHETTYIVPDNIAIMQVNSAKTIELYYRIEADKYMELEIKEEEMKENVKKKKQK